MGKKVELLFQLKHSKMVFLCVLVLITILVLIIKISKYSTHRLASAEGFEYMESVDLDGTDDKKYKVDIFWDELHIVPGKHRIMARIWTSSSKYNEQIFTSGNRRQLKSVEVKRQQGPDILMLNFETSFGSNFQTVNTVSAEGILGYPQKVEKLNEQE